MKALGTVEIRTGKIRKGLNLLKKAASAEPSNYDLWYFKGIAEMDMEMYVEADKSLSMAISICPDDINVILNYGLLQGSIGNSEKAFNLLDKALEKGAEVEEVFIHRGLIFMKNKEYKRAIHEYQKSLETKPDHYSSILRISDALLSLGRVDEALQHIGKAIGLYNDNINLFRWLCGNLMKLFRNANESVFKDYLHGALDIFIENGHLNIFSQALGQTIFSLLRKHKDISRNRFKKIVKAVEEAAAGKIDVSVHLRFLRTGIAYYFDKKESEKVNDKALLKLTSEERATFMEELGIEKL
jgi:tetratricopeptide (TPR) repeat protein